LSILFISMMHGEANIR